MSVAQVAMSHGINDNVVHRWRQLARRQAATQHAKPSTQLAPPAQPAEFVPLALPSPVLLPKADIRLEVQAAAPSRSASPGPRRHWAIWPASCARC